MIKSPLIIPAFLFILGIYVSSVTSINTFFTIIICSFLLILFFFKKKVFILLLLIFTIGILRNTSFYPQTHIYKLIQKKGIIVQNIVGRICSEVIKKDKKSYFIVELEKLNNIKTAGKINFSTTKDGLRYGDRIKTITKIERINRTYNPSSYNFEQRAEIKGIFAKGKNLSRIVVLSNSANNFKKVIIKIRNLLRTQIDSKFGENSKFVKTIILGEKSPELRELFILAGVSHILAISGLHVGLVSFFVFSLLNLFFSKRSSRYITIIILLIYAAVCNFIPSVTRATLMISIFLISKNLKRKHNINNTIATSALLIAIFSPAQVLSISFQMSFAAVIVLTNFVPKIKSSKSKIITFFIIYPLRLILVSFILNLFFAIITLHHFNQINFNSIFSNLLLIPLFSPILILTILVIIMPIGYSFYLFSFKLLYKLFIYILENFSKMPFYWKGLFVDGWVLLISFILLFVFFCFHSKKRWFILPIILILFIFSGKSETDKLKVIFFDAGMGDLNYIKTPEGKNILIDLGPVSYTTGFKSTALPYFVKNRIKEIDLLIITHAHNDHYGGFFDLYENLKIKKVVITDEFKSRKISKTILPKIKDLIILSDTITLISSKDLYIKALHPDKGFKTNSINNSSIVIRLDYREVSILFTGDIEDEAEKYLLKKYKDFLDVDILKVGHHGSKSSSNKQFIQAVSPDYSYIFAPLENRFNFPSQKSLKNLQGSKLFISGENGALVFSSDGKMGKFTTFKNKEIFFDYSF